MMLQIGIFRPHVMRENNASLEIRLALAASSSDLEPLPTARSAELAPKIHAFFDP